MRKSISQWAFTLDKTVAECMALARKAGYEGIEVVLEDDPSGERTAQGVLTLQALEQQARTIKHYGQANEFLINYPNIEYIVRDKLSTSKSVGSSDLPVQPKYALEYLKMYASAHQGAVVLDTKTGILRNATGNGSGQDESTS